MSDRDPSIGDEGEEAHGVSGTTRGDSRMEEEPAAPEEGEVRDWASKTETGGQATS